MAYWGTKSGDSDFASMAVTACVVRIREQLFKDIETVLSKEYPEQSIIATLVCLRAIAVHHRKWVKLKFSKSDYAKAKSSFEEWYGKVNSKIPAKYRKQVLEEANEEFKQFEEIIFMNNLTVNPDSNFLDGKL